MLAIVIPYYKFPFFESTLASLANQTDKRFKVYIGDDASIENPSLLLEKFKGTFSFHYHRFEHNMGGSSLVKQWERCIKMIEDEEWIMILGDDDILSENCVSEFYKNIDKINETFDVVRFASCNIDENGYRISNVFQSPIVESSLDFFLRKEDRL